METADLFERRRELERTVRLYFEACNESSREKFDRSLAEDAVQYFPPGVGGLYRGKEAIIRLWQSFVREKDSRWTIDRLVCDGKEAAVEWSHFKPGAAELIRGAEWYEFDESGRIREIRAYYASPRNAGAWVNELEGFPYARKGFAISPPGYIPGRQD